MRSIPGEQLALGGAPRGAARRCRCARAGARFRQARHPADRGLGVARQVRNLLDALAHLVEREQGVGASRAVSVMLATF